MGQGSLPVPHFRYEELQAKAEEFRRRCCSDEIAFPIERAVEYVLGLDIIPVPNLYWTAGVQGYLSSDRTTVYVDAHCCEQMEETYRYTLAHEVGHLELHAGLWERLTFNSTQSYRNTLRDALSDQEYSDVEWQANAFAGLVLVPYRLLRPVYEGLAEAACKTAKSYEGATSQMKFDVCQKVVCGKVADQFLVHEMTIGVRADYDGLSEWFAELLLGPGPKVIARGRLLDQR